MRSEVADLSAMTIRLRQSSRSAVSKILGLAVCRASGARRSMRISPLRKTGRRGSGTAAAAACAIRRAHADHFQRQRYFETDFASFLA